MQPGQTELTLMLEEVRNYNRQRRVFGDKASNEDIAGLKVLCVSWETTIQLLEGIWGRDTVDNTNLPLAAVATKCLDRSAELLVEKSCNPFWYEILTPLQPSVIASSAALPAMHRSFQTYCFVFGVLGC